MKPMKKSATPEGAQSRENAKQNIRKIKMMTKMPRFQNSKLKIKTKGSTIRRKMKVKHLKMK